MNVIGGKLSGETIKADIGGNLNLQSLQDSDNYDYEKLQSSVDLSIGVGNSSGNASLSQTEMQSQWSSVTDQSGIYAGKGGFDIKVDKNTDLKGAVIASQADADKNRLDTGTLSFSDIENKSQYEVNHSSISVGTSSINAPIAQNREDSATSTTHSAVEQGNIIIRDEKQQSQSVTELSRDTANANQTQNQLFDKQKEQDRLATIDLVNDIRQQASQIAENIEKSQGINQKDKTTGIAGSTTRAIDSVAAIVTGALTGDISGGLANASAPYLAEQIKQHTYQKDASGNVILDSQGQPVVDKVANTIAHVVLGGVMAELNGNSAASGAIGAAVGERSADVILNTLYPGKAIKDLTEDEKNYVVSLTNLASSLAGAASSGTIQDAATAAVASDNAVKNNYLSNQQKIDKAKELEQCETLACKASTQVKWTALSAGQDASLATGIVAGVPAELYDTVEALVGVVTHPGETYDAIKTLLQSDDITGEITEAVKQSYLTRLDTLQREYEQAGTEGAFKAGVEVGKLLTDIAGITAGGVGLAKKGAALSEKILAKSAGKGVTIDKISTTSVTAEYGPLNKGPLPDKIADTFRSGTYKEVLATDATTLYRVYGGNSKELGPYWTTTKPNGPVQSIIDSALDPKWGNTATKVFEIKVPAGTKFYQGYAAQQSGLVGGGDQVFFIEKVDSLWIVK